MADDQDLADRVEKAPEGYKPASPEKFQETITPALSNETLSRRAYDALGLGSLAGPYSEITRRQTAAEGEVAKAQQEQKMTEAKGKYEAEKKYASEMRSRYAEAEPTLMSKPPKFSVTKDTEEGLTGMAALMTVGGMIIGSKGATSGVNAMNAMTGVLKGYQEGNQQRIDFETKKYEKAMDEWKTTVQQTRDALARYEKLASVNLNEATAKAAMDAASKGQAVISAQIQQKGLTQTRADMDKMIDETRRVSQKMRDAMQEATGGVGTRATIAKMFGADVAARTEVKDAQKLIGQTQTIRETLDLIQLAKDPNIDFGELGRLKTKVEAAVRRNVGDTGTEIDPSQAAMYVDQTAKELGLNPNDLNVYFYKKAIFTALELERAARGGSILPVAVMKTLGPLLDPATTTREAYVAILADRANAVANATNLTQEQLNQGLTNLPRVRVQIPGATTTAAPAGKQTTSDGWTLEGP
jgi:hypothetical protein